jgi:hypothetical protein
MARVVRAAWSAALLAGPPLVLWRLGGSPVPSGLPSREALAAWVRQPLDPGFVDGVCLLAGWLVWAALALAAAAEGYVRVARCHRRLPRLALPHPLRALAATVFGAAAVTASTAPPVASAQAAAAAGGDTTGADRASPRQASPAPATGPVYRVVPGDRIWSIAGRFLHDPRRYPEIAALNPRYAAVYDDFPDHIEPGDQLRLPTVARDRGVRAHARGTLIAAPPPHRPPVPPHIPPSPRPSPPSALPGDDGVADACSLTTPAPTTSRPATGSASHPAVAGPSTPARSSRSRPPGVTLTGDSWVDLGLAAAVAAAATVVWRLRRRRYTPRPPTAQAPIGDADLAPMPPVVTRLRRGLTAPAPHDDTGVDDLADPAGAVTASAADTDADCSGGTDPRQRADAAAELNLPALGNPILAAWPPAGLGLIGPGAEAAARGLLASALAAGVDDPHGRAGVVVPAATLTTLLGAATSLPETPRLTVTGDLAEALQLLEEQTLHRTRLVHGHEVDTVAQLREVDPDEQPLPPILLLADAPVPHERTRIAALLAQGQRLDIHGVLLGEWPDGDTVVVAGDGTTTPADGEPARHGAHRADLGRLTVLTAAEAAALLPVLAESHTGLPQPALPQPPSDAAAAGTTVMAGHLGQPAHAAPVASGRSADSVPPGPPASTAAAADVPADKVRSDVDGLAAGVPTGPGRPGEQDLDGDDADGDGEGPGVVAVRVLGRPSSAPTRVSRCGPRPWSCWCIWSPAVAAPPSTRSSRTWSPTPPCPRPRTASTPMSTPCARRCAVSAGAAPTSPTPATATS